MSNNIGTEFNQQSLVGRWFSRLKDMFNFNSINARKYFQNDVDKIFEIQESQYAKLDVSLDDFKIFARAKTAEWQKQLQNGEVGLEDIKHEAFALVLETSRRKLGMESRICQVECGLALHAGSVTEMNTGEGKTLAATMPVYLNALKGDGVHVMTVNDYLASRDAAWM
jgi:preprotein translocase subunit SecA